MEVVLSWVRTLVIYLILIAVILNIIPSDQYRKYVRLFLGLILTILIARPLLGLFREDSLLNGYLEYYQIITNKESGIPELEQVEEQQRSAIIEAWKTQIREDLEVSANEKGWHITEMEINLSDEETAKITQIQIGFQKQEDEDFIVAPVVITKGGSIDKKKKEIQQWKTEIAKKYQVDETQISIQELG